MKKIYRAMAGVILALLLAVGAVSLFTTGSGGDGADTNVSPEYAMILRGLRNSRIVGNTAYKGYVAQLLLDYGGHRDTEIAGNPGTAYAR